VLEEMRIRGLGVIEAADLSFGPGLTVITGETGAGKTMVLTGLGLLLGGRADAGRVRPGADLALVEGRVRVDPGAPVAERATEAGALLDEDALLISRTVGAEGRSRAHLGGRAVPAALLAELADDLVAVHGQSDQHRLLRPAQQRAALDRAAGEAVLQPLAAYAAGYRRLATLTAQWTELTAAAAGRVAEAELLRAGLAAVEQVDPRPGEDVELASLAARLGHAEELRAAVGAAHTALVGADEADPGDGGDALGPLAAARKALAAAAGLDPALARLADRAAELTVLALDLAGEVATYQASIDVDPARLAAVEQRRAELATLTRPHGGSLPETLAWAEEAAARLLDLVDDGDRIDRLAAQRAALRDELAARAAEISAARRAAATRLAAAVADELRDLGMPRARVEIHVDQATRPDGAADALVVAGATVAFGPTGVDEVEILLAPHAGAPLAPLARGASGGELSRIMLALEVVLAGADPVPTLVFDEVDAGVGGRAAVEVGRRLARLSRTAQVVVVTHLPQVAAFADRHLCVVKDDDGAVTTSGITALDDDGRVRELARMLAGLDGSATALAHAHELLGTARGG
jgi:DNA repair protein RecN (Recombination protein N)